MCPQGQLWSREILAARIPPLGSAPLQTGSWPGQCFWCEQQSYHSVHGGIHASLSLSLKETSAVTCKNSMMYF